MMTVHSMLTWIMIAQKMVGPADFDISFDTDSGISVDTHTFTESLTSDSPNESFFRLLCC